MPLPKPYYRICRPYYDTRVQQINARNPYLLDPRYAPDRQHLIHAYGLLEKALLDVFDYVEPAEQNLKTFSQELYQLLLRACTELETNAKAILTANGYQRPGNWNVGDYQRIERACKLSEYRVTFPLWTGNDRTREPFRAWKTADPLRWYQAYNSVKHDRLGHFSEANLENVLDAVAGVFALLFAQFFVHAFEPLRAAFMHLEDNGKYMYPGSLLEIEMPQSWTDDEKYGFDWAVLSKKQTPFQQFPFCELRPTCPFLARCRLFAEVRLAQLGPAQPLSRKEQVKRR